MNVAVILAGGVGRRIGLSTPKQFFKVAGKMVVEHTIDTFERNAHIDEIAIVSNASFVSEFETLVMKNGWKKVKKILNGGKERYDSSLSAIYSYEGKDNVRLIFHDAVRPLVSQHVISEVVNALDSYDAVGVAVPSADTLIEVDGDFITSIPDRSRLRRVQTPQAFKLETIRAAYDKALKDPDFSVTDDCGVVKKYLPDVPIYIVEGEGSNIKLTYREDMYMLEKLFQVHKVSDKRRKLWDKEKSMLRVILAVCERHGLRVWMDGGSLLGVVRHKGFIPWDDDIDLTMMRDDYDRFINIPQEEFAPYFLQTAYTDKDYFHGHAQLRDRHTTATSPTEWRKDYCQGIFVDIFPLDAVPDNKEEYEELSRRSMEMKQMMEAKGGFYLFKQRDVIGNIKTWWKARRLFKRIDFKDYYREFEDLFRRYRPEDNAAVGTISFIPSLARDKEIYSDTVWLPFEDMMVPAPKDYDKELRSLYGDDYMKPRRAPAFHGGLIVDTERPYTEVIRDIRREHTFCKDVMRRLRRLVGMKNKTLLEETLMVL